MGMRNRTPRSRPGWIGAYRLGECLGEGGMGVVYRAQRRGRSEPVALKLVRDVDEGLLATFRREIYALETMNHPGVVQIVDHGVDGGRPWYAMELLVGEPLDRRIDSWRDNAVARARRREAEAKTAQSDEATSHVKPISESPTKPMANPTDDTLRPGAPSPSSRPPSSLPRSWSSELEPAVLKEILHVVAALCEPLAYVHGRGIVHRDLKPDNVVIDSAGAPILVDFGLASMALGEKSRDVLDVGGRALGTPAYMAPEQIRGDLVDARADLYALGCILYECIVGQTPFSGSTVTVLNRHLNEDPRSPGELVRGVPRALDVLVMKLLQKRAEQRIGYAEDVARQLDQIAKTSTPRRGPAPGAYLYRPTLAGRGAALARLERALEPTPWQEGAFALIAGRSGMGKTRLATELANRAARTGVRVVVGRGSESTAAGLRGAPLSLLTELLLAIADRCEANPTLAEELLGTDGKLLAAFEPRFGAPPDTTDIDRPELFTALGRVVARMAKQQSLFLVLDDLHGADELSIAFLDSLTPEYFAQTPLQIVGTLRTEEHAPWLMPMRRADHITHLELDELGEGAVADMVAGMLALPEPPSALVHFVVRATEGIPFFVAEYLRTAVEAHVLWRSGEGRWRVGPEGFSVDALERALPMPGGLLDLVRRRLDQLSEPAREVVRFASVAGRQVSEQTLREVAQVLAAHVAREATWRPAIEELRARAVLEDAPRGDLRFCHDKLREVVYEGLSDEARREVHLQVARSIERGLDAEEQPARRYVDLVRHFGAAEAHDETMVYLEKAGRHAMLTAAFDDARQHYARLLELAERHLPGGPSVAQRVRWERRLGEASYSLGDLAAAERHLEACLACAGRGGRLDDLLVGVREAVRQVSRWGGVSPSRRANHVTESISCDAANAAERLCQVYFFQNQRTRAFLASLRCLHHAESWGPSPELARSYASISVAMGFVPAPVLVERYGVLAQRVAEQDGNLHARAYVSFLRGLSRHGDGHPTAARIYLERAVSDALEAGELRAAQEAMTVLSNVMHQLGLRREAVALAHEVRELAERSGNDQGRAWSAGNLALASMVEGDFAAALEHFEEMVRLTRAHERAQRLANGMRAAAHLRLGDRSRALEVAKETIALGRGQPPTAFHSIQGFKGALTVLLEHLEATDDRAEWNRFAPLLEEGLAQLTAYTRVFGLGRPTLDMYRAGWLRVQGSPRRGRRHARRAVAFALRRGLVWTAASAQLELALCHERGTSSGRREASRAVELCDRASLRYWGAVARELERS